MLYGGSELGILASPHRFFSLAVSEPIEFTRKLMSPSITIIENEPTIIIDGDEFRYRIGSWSLVLFPVKKTNFKAYQWAQTFIPRSFKKETEVVIRLSRYFKEWQPGNKIQSALASVGLLKFSDNPYLLEETDRIKRERSIFNQVNEGKEQARIVDFFGLPALEVPRCEELGKRFHDEDTIQFYINRVIDIWLETGYIFPDLLSKDNIMQSQFDDHGCAVDVGQLYKVGSEGSLAIRQEQLNSDCCGDEHLSEDIKRIFGQYWDNCKALLGSVSTQDLIQVIEILTKISEVLNRYKQPDQSFDEIKDSFFSQSRSEDIKDWLLNVSVKHKDFLEMDDDELLGQISLFSSQHAQQQANSVLEQDRASLYFL